MNLLKTLYEIHSPSGNEKAMKKFIKGYVKKHIPGVTIKNDHVGNLYMIKGNAETYPCIVAHLDQVQREHSKIQGNRNRGYHIRIQSQEQTKRRAWSWMIRMVSG